MLYSLLMGNSIPSCREDVTRIKSLISTISNICDIYFDCHTLKTLIAFLDKYCFQKEDILHIHYSGHGERIGKKIGGKIEMISTWINSDQTYTSSFQVDKILSKVNCKIVLTSDSCHSGEFGKFYEGLSPFIFIGSSSFIHKSGEYSLGLKNKAGILTHFFEYLLKNFEVLEIDKLKEIGLKYFRKNRIRINPIIKIFGKWENIGIR